MREVEEVKVLEQWRVDYKLPDPDFKCRALASKILKEHGCTVFQEHKYYQICDDNEHMTVIGYKVEPVSTRNVVV